MPEPSMLSCFRFYLPRQPCLESKKKRVTEYKAVSVFHCSNITDINQVHIRFLSKTQSEFHYKILFKTRTNLPFQVKHLFVLSPLLVLVGYVVQIINYMSNVAIMNILYLHSMRFYLYRVSLNFIYIILLLFNVNLHLFILSFY